MDSRANEEFTLHLREAVREAEKLKYFPSRFKAMIEAYGGFITVKNILASGRPSDGFQKLWELGRLDLTCEAIIVESKWRRYFDDDLLQRAEALLAGCKYVFTRFDILEVSGAAPSQGTDAEDDFVPSSDDQRDHAQREIALRPWQGQFRDALFERYGARCCVSGCGIREALEAAHITPYLGAESNDLRNGLILRSDLHTLFDRYLFGVDPETLSVRLANSLADEPNYREFNNLKLIFPPGSTPSKNALHVHWKRFLALG
jgi:hypothetical protein